MVSSMTVFIGMAGWALRKETIDQFPRKGTHLERYASRLNCVEINSSFYRPHRKATYARWQACTPPDFKFSVKIPKRVTHEKRLVDCEPELDRFIDEVSGLGAKLGPLLLQLPPSFAWQEDIAGQFLSALRARHAGPIACEPRHKSWFDSEASNQLIEFGIDRVAADPAVVVAATTPGGAFRTCYFRWRGSPVIYYSSYDDDALQRLASTIGAYESRTNAVWCIFDNTAENAALSNAFHLRNLISGSP